MVEWLSAFLIVGIVFLVVSFSAAYLLKKLRKIPVKRTDTPYECGEEPHKDLPFPIKPLFIIPLVIFIVFEAELLFLFPWAKAINNNIIFILVGVIFIVILLLPLLLFFKWKVIGWRKGQTEINPEANNVPYDLYEKINKKYENG